MAFAESRVEGIPRGTDDGARALDRVFKIFVFERSTGPRVTGGSGESGRNSGVCKRGPPRANSEQRTPHCLRRRWTVFSLAGPGYGSDLGRHGALKFKSFGRRFMERI